MAATSRDGNAGDDRKTQDATEEKPRSWYGEDTVEFGASGHSGLASTCGCGHDHQRDGTQQLSLNSVKHRCSNRGPADNENSQILRFASWEWRIQSRNFEGIAGLNASEDAGQRVVPGTAGTTDHLRITLVIKCGERGMQLANILVRLRGALAVRDPEVATALRLSDTQQIRIRDVSQQNLASLRGRVRELIGRRGTLRDVLREAGKQSEQQMLTVLTPEQRKKLEHMQ
jgi:hypothetical protein